MLCPVCKQDMLVIEYHAIELDYCPECRGVWFDAGELDLLLEAHELAGAGSFRERILNSPEAASAEKPRKCPICARKMKKVNAGEPPAVLIDVCRREHGLWFDGGEVSQLLRNLPGGGAGSPVIAYIEEVFGTGD